MRFSLFCLRFACILGRSRNDEAIPEFNIGVDESCLTIHFDANWASHHPLTLTDLEQEKLLPLSRLLQKLVGIF